MQGKLKPLFRYLAPKIDAAVDTKTSFLLLGPRQVGKTTLLQASLKAINNTPLLTYYLQDPSVRLSLERDPGLLIRDVRAQKGHVYIYIDEAQKIPSLFDAAQLLIDEGKASFFITGSSARALRRKGVNLLPGRIKHFFLDPLLWSEMGMNPSVHKEILPPPINIPEQNIFYTFEDSLVFGSLPGIVLQEEKERVSILSSYTHLYIEEEIRAEALSRNIGAFSRFLELAAYESGTNPNLSKLSQESGVSVPTIKEYYNILEDTLIATRIGPYLKNARKRILSSSRYYFFDLGVRNILARLPLSLSLIQTQKGVLFEHAVMLEILRRIRLFFPTYRVYYWRTSGGAEVDCIIDCGEYVIPIEIKSGSSVRPGEIKGLSQFLIDYASIAPCGYVISQSSTKQRIADNIIMLPWFEM